MKVCAYCESSVSDDVVKCPFCSATKFLKQCSRCGEAYTGPDCPTCKEAAERERLAEEAREEARREAEREAHEEAQAREKANSHLVLKTVLTFFLPIVGGYFVINKRVNKPNRIFGIIWCFLFALSSSTIHNTVGMKIFMVLLALAPVAVYVVRGKAWVREEASTELKVTGIALVVVLLLSFASAIASGDTSDPTDTSGSTSSRSATSSTSAAAATSASSASSSVSSSAA